MNNQGRFYDGIGIDSDVEMEMGLTGGLIASAIEVIIGGMIYYALKDETIATRLLLASPFFTLAAFHSVTAIYDIINGYKCREIKK